MLKKNIRPLLVVIIALSSAISLLAQDTAPAVKPVGTLMVQGKDYPLKHALAYETAYDDEEVIAVVLSGQVIWGEALQAARAAEKEGQDPEFKPPFLRVEFTKAGEFKAWNARAGNTSLGRRAGNATGAIKLQDGRVSGQANQPNDGDAMFASGFDVSFDVALLKAGAALPASMTKKRGPASSVKPSVTGTFKGNGKEAKLAHFSAHWREPFSDEPSMALIFTEKDHSKDKKPEMNAAFGRFGSALIISLHEDGGIFGCQVVHMAHEKQGFSSIGSIKTEDFEYANGQVQGELTTDGQVETFGETWEIKLKFVAPMGETPAEFLPKKKEEPKSAAADEVDEPAAKSLAKSATRDEATAATTKDQLNVKDLALTKDATDIEYKTLVEHLLFKSKGNVKSAATEMSASLKAQGWATDGRDLITPASAILKRKREGAALTIFVKPEGAGSEVKMFTEGLSWEEK